MNPPTGSQPPSRSGTVALLGAVTAIAASAVGWVALMALDTDGLAIWFAGGAFAVVGLLVGLIAGVVAIRKKSRFGKAALLLSLFAVVTWVVEWSIAISSGNITK